MDREDLVVSMVERCLEVVTAVFVGIELCLSFGIDAEEGHE